MNQQQILFYNSRLSYITAEIIKYVNNKFYNLRESFWPRPYTATEGLEPSIFKYFELMENKKFKMSSYHSFLISTLTLSILLFILKPTLILNSTLLLSLSLFYI